MFWLIITLIALWLLKKGLDKAQSFFQSMADESERSKQMLADELAAARWQEEEEATIEEKRRLKAARERYEEFKEQNYEARVRAEIESLTRGG